MLAVLADHPRGVAAQPAGGIGVARFLVVSGFLITGVTVEARDHGALVGAWMRSEPVLVLPRFVARPRSFGFVGRELVGWSTGVRETGPPTLWPFIRRSDLAR